MGAIINNLLRNFLQTLSRRETERLKTALLAFAISFLAVCGPAWAIPKKAVAMHGEPALAEGFTHFDYVNPNAPKNGRLRLAQLGSFDNLNPLIVKGTSAAGMREFSIESLMARSLDEPFTLYGLIAETIDIADDEASVTFELNPKASFSNRTPITADDVLGSFELLKTKGRPNHRTYFSKVIKAEKLGERRVRFVFQDNSDRELPLILGLMPVFSSKTIDPETFDQTTLKPLVASGPYTVSKVDPGRALIFERDPDYWGKDLPVNRGRFNFDEISFDYFRDGSVMLEAFKRGAVDLRLEEDPGRWAEGYDIPAVRDGRILKEDFEIGLPAGMSALVFNTRRRPFKDPRVRHALMTLFDAELINRTLFNGLYERSQSYFARSYLSSAGKPADAIARALLAPFPEAVRSEILEGKFRFPVSDGSGQNRPNQKRAFALLTEAGYTLNNGKLVEAQTGTPLEFEILAYNGGQEPLLLSYARSLEPFGIKARVRIVDSAQYQQRLATYDYDMIQNTWSSSLSPGNEQLFRWSAANADVQGSFNFAGVKNAAVDAMIDAMLRAKTQEEFVSAVHALDRVLLSGDYVIPLFHPPRQWVAYWKRLKHPEKTPLFGYALDTWWIEEGK